MAGLKKTLKFKDAPKKTRKKRKTVDKAKSTNKPVVTQSKPKQTKAALPKVDKQEKKIFEKPQNPIIPVPSEEPVKLFGMGETNSRNGFVTHFKTFGKTIQSRISKIQFGGFDKTSWKGLQNPSGEEDDNGNGGDDKPKEKTGKNIKAKQEKESKQESTVKDSKQAKITTELKSKTQKLLPAGTLLMLPAPKEKKNGVGKDEFPKIYRVITETWFQVAVLSIVLLVSIGLMFKELHQHMQQKSALEQKRAGIQKQITYWQGVVQKYQDYRDGYFKLALLEYQLGNTQAAESYIEKTKMLDPNFAEADKLESMLSK